MSSFFASQIRIARPVSNLKEIQRFYGEGLGLPLIGHFENHQGISGIMLGLPDGSIHLEFTQHEDEISIQPPSKEHLLVLYMRNSDVYHQQVNRLQEMGYACVAPENPYWLHISETFEDPDGWRVVLVNRPQFSVS